MIYESSYWKQPLLEMADRLRILKVSDDISEEQAVQIERDIFIGFYSIRKLIETVTKITDETKLMKVMVSWHANKTNVNLRNNHKIDELYDLKFSQKESRDISFICGRIIHSFIFMPVLGESGLAGMFFTSDTDKQKRLYYIAVDDVISIFERVGRDNPTLICWEIDSETGDEILVVK